MIIECPSCKSKYKYDESKLAGGSKKVKCPKCKGVIEVSMPVAPAGAPNTERTYASMPMPRNVLDSTLSSDPKTAKVKRDALLNAAQQSPDAGAEYLKMPENRKYSLALIQGQNSGEIFQISRPRMTIGRSEADIVIQDMEASRQHARIDIMGDRVVLRDLNSTNGTYVDDEKIATYNLENHSEFRIGTTVLMLIITDLD
jgi:predicted Zn finger-like uncharacterized protein